MRGPSFPSCLRRSPVAPRGPLARLGVAIGLVWLCACAGSPARPASPARTFTARDFYPLDRGWKWAYDVEKDGQPLLAVYAVVARDGDQATVLAGDEPMGYLVAADGVAHRDGGITGDYEIRDPVRTGATWPVTGGKATITAIGPCLTVPAGTFMGCATVDIARDDPARVVRTTFAPEVGPVAIDYQVVEPGGAVTLARARLRGVTRPGADPFAVTSR